MEDLKVLESMESLWFCSNVFSSSRIIEVDERKLKPISRIVETDKTQLVIESIVAEESPKSRDSVAEENRAFEETEEEHEKKTRKVRKNRRVKNWLDYGFYNMNEIDKICMKMMMMDGNSKISDEIAMREHLKTWAYSVACAVK